jgi:membrane-associated phospholipid phosphatase
MLRSARHAAIAALVCLGGLALTGIVAFAFPIAHARDSVALAGFSELDRPRLTGLLDRVAHLADPLPYAIFGVVCIGVALLRRRPRTAIAIPIIMVGAELTTQSLKSLLAHPRVAEWLGNGQIAAASWPSGHATAAMAVALCAVLAAPPRLRPAVGALGGLFAIAVAYAILALHWHFPSDVVGGYLVALMWTLAGVAAILWSQDRHPARTSSERGPNQAEAAAPFLVGAGVIFVGALVLAIRPERSGQFASGHLTFMLVAGGIAVLAATIALGFARALSGWLPAPIAARPRGRSRPG